MILALLALLAVQQPPLSKDPIRDWMYQRKEINPRTGREEVTVILQGAEAVPLDLTKGREIFQVRGAAARYFTEPRKPGDKSEEIRISAERARMDNAARVLELKDRVRVEKADGSLLSTPSALLRFHSRWVCPACGTLEEKAGLCPDHNTERREKTTIDLECDRDFELLRPDGIIRGELLSADDAIRELKILRNGFLELSGEPASIAGAATGPVLPPLRAAFTQVHSKGPLHLREGDGQTVVRGSEGIRVDRIDAKGTMTLTARQGTVVAALKEDPVTLRKTLVPRLVDASGDVKLDGSTFGDGASHFVSGETLLWEIDPQQDYTFDLARLSSPDGALELRTGSNVLRSRRLILDRSSGLALFEGQVQGRLSTQKNPKAPPMELACDHLSTRLSDPEPGVRRGISFLEATGHVVLGGLMDRDGAEPGRAEADRFVWDAVEERGLLEARPVVRILRGRSVITAPRIVLESPELIVLKGPKHVRMIQESEGKTEEYRATCEGDLILDQVTGLLKMRDDCLLKTGDLQMRAGRIDAVLGTAGRGLESLLARGDVRIRRLKDGTNLYGERLVFKPADQSFTLHGSPYAVADTGRTLMVQERIQVYEKPAGDGQRVRYTEMIGGKDGLRIVIEDKGR